MRKIRCIVCQRKLKEGQAQVLRIGEVRNGPLCRRCANDIVTELEAQGMTIVPNGGDVPPGAPLINPLLPGTLFDEDNIRARAKGERADIVFLWDFPENDFPLWHELWSQELGSATSDLLNTYTEYQVGIIQVKRELESQGIQAVLVKATIREMMAACKEIGVSCDSQGRSNAIGHLGLRQLYGDGAGASVLSEPPQKEATMNDELNPVVTHAIEDMWTLCDALGSLYWCPKGDGPQDGPDWQDRCVLWFRSQEAAERFFDDKTKHSTNLLILVPRPMGSQWRKLLRAALNNGAKWAVGIGYRNGQMIRSPYLSIRDLLEGRLPNGLIVRTGE